jgi:Zn finger protein HypA/HybF involved in hydrogenase expression
MLCSYGCGEPALFTLKSGKPCCSKSHNSCKVIKDKNAAGLSKAYAEGRRDCSQFDGKRDSNKGKSLISNDSVFVEGGTQATEFLKTRILKDSLLSHKCSECDLGSEWNGKPIVLELDHVNGVNNDNRLENLRFLCPNCHSQTPTFRGRGNTGKTKVTDEQLLTAYKECSNIRQTLIKVGLAPKGGNYTRVVKLINGAMVERSTQGT